MSETHELVERAEHFIGDNRRIALLISVLALFLALSETLGKSAQTSAISDNVQASDLWAFFQAKTIRQTVLRTASEALALSGTNNDAVKSGIKQKIDEWQKVIDRYEVDPEKPEGRKQLSERALALEHSRDTALAKYHNYEIASAAFQIGIVLASASVITGMTILVFLSAGIGVLGILFTAFGLVAPELIHLALLGGH
ncbi:MAG: DUF4337 domain-containing protein [Bradyrhizobiaceae bacterium]|nr:DUF4337 domain-containing protein [Bradyrhizobiaceae bacterium]